MKVSGEAWFTYANDDGEALDALVLAESLRRCRTNRKILLFFGCGISNRMKLILSSFFHSLIPMEDYFAAHPGMEKDPKSSALHLSLKLPKPYSRCVFLDNKLLVLKNIDDLYEFGDGTICIDDGNILVTIINLSLAEYEKVEEAFRRGSTSNMIRALKSKMTKDLPEHYCVTMENGSRRVQVDSVLSLLPKMIHVGELLSDGNNCPISKYWNNLKNFAMEKVTNDDIITLQPHCTWETEPIAIVGMACRFPGANNLDEFWDVLVNGRDQLRPVPDHRWTDRDGIPTTNAERSIPCGFLKCPVDGFDSKFFGLSPLELNYMDPQHRLSLEVTWEALEDAAISPESIHGSYTGIYTGAWKYDYYEMMTETGFRVGEFFRSYMGNAYGANSGRLAHILGVTGPNIASESGCSSSIASIGLATKSLRSHVTNLCIVTGVNLILRPYSYDTMKPLISIDGRCKTFDASANGYARAEGVASIVLKRLSDAVRDGDRIHAMIRGYGEAQEGLTKSMGTPTAECEALAMEKALIDSGVRPDEVSYLEAHGTGTLVGDPLEIEAIRRVYQKKNKERPLMIGSVKTVIGHAESCSGMAGLIKTVLALKNEIIPPHLHLKEVNPRIDLSLIPAEVPTEAREWRKDSKGNRRIAAVSSYGLTGTDAHLLLEEAPEMETPSLVQKMGKHILAISAKSEEALEAVIESYIEFLTRNAEHLRIEDVCCTANIGRSHFPYRIAVIGETLAELAEKLMKRNYLKASNVSLNTPGSSKTGLLFTGQGSQYWKMAENLYKGCPVFRHNLDKVTTVFEKEYGLDIKKYIWGPEPNPQLHLANNSQPTIFAVGYALLEFWKFIGIEPSVLLGHSLGEVCSAVAAGTLTMEEGARLTVERGSLCAKFAPSGRMLAVKAGEREVEELIKEWESSVKVRTKETWIDIATINTASQTVVSGKADSVQSFADLCKRKEIKVTFLDAEQAFHSRDMQVILPNLEPVLDRLLGSSTKSTEVNPNLTYISSLKGKAWKVLDKEYWLEHTRHSVKFVEASVEAWKTGCKIFLEVGAQPVLSALLKGNTESVNASSGNEGTLACLPSIRKKEDEWTTILSTIGQLYTLGVNINWKNFHKFYEGKKVSLPSYPFQRKRFWFEVKAGSKSSRKGQFENENTLHPLAGRVFPTSLDGHKIFQGFLDVRKEGKLSYIQDHKLGSRIIFPGAGYLEMALATGNATVLNAFEELYPPGSPILVENLKILTPLELIEDEEKEVQTVVKEGKDEWLDIQIASLLQAGKFRNHVKCRFSSVHGLDLEKNEAFERSCEDLGELRKELKIEEDMNEFYEIFKENGLNFADKFKSLKKAWTGSIREELLLEVDVPEDSENYFLHPIVVDAMIQALLVGEVKRGQMRIPVEIGRFLWFGKRAATEKTFIHVADAHAQENGNAHVKKFAVLYDSDGKKLAVMSQVTFVNTSIESINRSLGREKVHVPLLFENGWKQKSIEGLGFDRTLKNWIVFSEENDLSKEICEGLRKQGCKNVVIVQPGNGGILINPRNKDDMRKIFEKCLREFSEKDVGILYMYGVESEKLGLQDVTHGFLNLEQIVIELAGRIKARLFVVTEGALFLSDQGPLERGIPHSGTLWGMTRTLRSEYSTFYCKTIDIEPESLNPGKEIVQEILLDPGKEEKEYQVAYRAGKRFVCRLTPVQDNVISSGKLLPPGNSSTRFTLALPETKSVSDLKYVPLPMKLSIAANDVEISVHSFGLNFKDVLNIIKPSELFKDSNVVGADFAGVVTRIGKEVKSWKVGDAVLGCDWRVGAARTHLTVNEKMLTFLPQDWTFAEGATLATAFGTAYHCVVTVGQLKANETLLIHTASGAVGLYAIQIAKLIGATVIATAGSKRKRAYLKAIWKVDHVFNSRSLDFAEKIRKVTGGKGVEVIVNSLTSPGFKEASLSVLAKGGRFVEMAKLNIFSEEEVKETRPDVAYNVVEMSYPEMDPVWVEIYKTLRERLQKGEIRPIGYARFDAYNIREAVGFMQKTKHVGKVVCVMPENDQGCPLFNERSSYIITGGVGGIGLEVSKWMCAQQGAKTLILCCRSEPKPTEKAAAVIQELNSNGNRVIFVKADIGKMDECRTILQVIREERLPPLKGIMHCAGCLADALIPDQSWDKFEKTFNGKVSGALNLHNLTLEENLNLEHFVMFSSVIALFGMGQSNHAAGNAFLDSLAFQRHAMGLAATTVNWGQWGMVGIAAGLEVAGLAPFSPEEGLAALEVIMKGQRLQTLVVEGDTKMWRLLFSWAERYFEEVKVNVKKVKGSSGTGSDDKKGDEEGSLSTKKFWKDFEENQKEQNGKCEVVRKMVVSVLQFILKLGDKEDLAEGQNVQELGLDSLMIVELKNVIQAVVGPKINIEIGEIEGIETVGGLTEKVLSMIEK